MQNLATNLENNPGNHSLEQGRQTQTRFYLFSSELIALFSLLAMALLYQKADINFRSPAKIYTERITGALIFYALSILVSLLLTRLSELKDKTEMIGRRETFSRFAKQHLRPGLILTHIRLLNSVCIVFLAYINLLHVTPLINSRLYDLWFTKTEQGFFGGHLAAEWMIVLFSKNLASILSSAYTLFYPYMGLLVLLVLLQKNIKLTHEFFTAFVTVFTISALLTIAYPTWGPCYYLPQLFSILPQTEVSHIQQQAWKVKLFLDQHPHSPKGIYFITAFPSPHLAIPLLGAVYTRNISRLFSYFSWVFAGATVVTTLYFGWHYFLDDAAAIFVVWASILLAKQRLLFPPRALSRE